MITTFAKINCENPQENIDDINNAASIIKKGGLVAFPTETVYGLGADALNPIAVKKIYEAKGRPSDNPLIVHICNINQLHQIAKDISLVGKKLAEAFWPGALTLIFRKNNCIPNETSGGLDTVAVRFPSNKTALLLLEQAKTPIAAPSANTSGKPSPTKAEHVKSDLDGKIDMIIDGGSCEFGLESTIVDVSGDKACILRPGSITEQMIKEVIGEVGIDQSILKADTDNSPPKAPGMKYKHYSPSANVTIVCGETLSVSKKINELLNQCNKITGVMATEETKHLYDSEKNLVLVVGERKNPKSIASNLFDVLRKFDYYNVEEVFAEGFSENDVYFAIMNRLKKAAGFNVIRV